MIPKSGDVYLIDLGMAGKVRPVVVVSREDANAPRALSVVIPLTSQNRGSGYEVELPRVPWLKVQSFANVQGIGHVGHHELTERRGRFEPAAMDKIKESLRWALEL